MNAREGVYSCECKALLYRNDNIELVWRSVTPNFGA